MNPKHYDANGQLRSYHTCPGCSGPKAFQAKMCRPCRTSANAAIPKDPVDYHHAYKLRAFGLTPDDYLAMLDSQGGRCYACGREPNGKRLSVDHDHKTGLVRGLLCNICNRTLGHIERDGIAVVEKLLSYLAAPPAVAVVGERFGGTGRVGTKKWRKQARKRA